DPVAKNLEPLQRPRPDLPTVAQSGLPGFDTSIWFGLLAPVGTPDGIRDQLAEAIGQALNSEGVIKALRAQEMEPLQGGPAAFAGEHCKGAGKGGGVGRQGRPQNTPQPLMPFVSPPPPSH